MSSMEAFENPLENNSEDHGGSEPAADSEEASASLDPTDPANEATAPALTFDDEARNEPVRRLSSDGPFKPVAPNALERQASQDLEVAFEQERFGGSNDKQRMLPTNKEWMKLVAEEDEYLGITPTGANYTYKYRIRGAKDTLAGVSLGIWETSSNFRQSVFVITHHRAFEGLILLCIIIQAALMALTIPGDHAANLERYPELDNILQVSELIFLCIYTVEMILKLIGLGLYDDQHAYLKSNWNVMDCFLVSFGWFYICLKLIGLSNLINPSIVRMIRCIRPLRTLSFLQGVKAALGAWPYLVDIGLLMGLALALFGVLGVQLFGGATTYVCLAENAGVIDNVTCPNQLFCESRICSVVPGKEAPVWGFDNLGQALLSGWIASTGDQWTPNMVETYSLSESRYAAAAWSYFMVWGLVLNLVFANLFTAVIINSFLENHKQTEDPDLVASAVRKEITLFNRIDADRTGTIAVAELETLAAILDLDNKLFTDEELTEARRAMDVTGDGTVDFEEFTNFWHSNGTFVVKLKKALRRQEDEIHKAWDMIDEDGSGTLCAEEIALMAEKMHIQLSDEELALAMEEMNASEGEVDFNHFSNWWLSSSKIASKVKAASKNNDQGSDATRMFRHMDEDGGGGLTQNEILTRSRLAFSRELTEEEAAQLFEEAIPTGASEGSDVFAEDFDSWWISGKDLATQLREERRKQVVKVRGFVENLEVMEDQGMSPRAVAKAAASGASTDLGRLELEQVISDLKLRCPLPDLMQSITSTMFAEEIEPEDENFDARASFKPGTSSAGWEKPVNVSLRNFTDWIISPEELAVAAIEELDATLKRELDRLVRPFPWVPGISPAFASLSVSGNYDAFMTIIVVANTCLMATAHHEQEIDSPDMTKFVQDSEIFFTVLYVLEVLIRTFGMGITAYLSDTGFFFDFLCTAMILIGELVPGASYAASFRSIRVMVKCLRVARSAKILLKAEQVQYLLKTVLEESRDLALLAMFVMFMLILMTVVAGHTLGVCHIQDDGTADKDLPLNNFFTFRQSLQSNFLVMMGARWSEIMFDYMKPTEANLTQHPSCVAYSWIFFVGCFSVMKFFAGNLFVAMIVDGFTLSEQEKLVKQEKNHLQSMAEESKILREMGMAGADGLGDANSMGGAIDGFRALRDSGAQDVLLDGLKEVPKPADVMKMMSKGARVQKLSGPMAQMKKEMGRQGNKVNSLADKASGGQLKKIQEEAEKRVKAMQEEVERVAAEASKAALDATNKAATAAAAVALEKVEEAKKRAEAALVEAASKMDEAANADLEEDTGMTPEERKKEMSWNVFMMESAIRKFCIRTVDNPTFEPAILGLICLSSLSIAAEGPPNNHALDDQPVLANLFHIVNIGILVVFWLEFWLHTIAEGFYGTHTAYLTKAWHRMDFFVLIVCTIEFVMTYVGEGDAVRILRVIRVWRPLQLIKHNDAMTVLLEALANVVPVMMGVLGLMTIFYTSFAIFGTGVFMGKFASCNCEGKWALPSANCTVVDYKTLGMDACIAQGGTWENPPWNFDSFGDSMQTLFYSSSGALKVVMTTAMDVTEVYEAPEYQSSFWYASFFWVFIVFNRYLIKNLLVGLLCNYFLMASGSSLLTSNQQQWAQCQMFVLMTPAYVKPEPEEGTLRKSVYKVVTHGLFEPVVTCVVIVNVAIMFLEGAVQDTGSFATVKDIVQETCMWIFTIDVCACAFAYGSTDYWKDPWAKLDILIVISSWLSKLGDFGWISVLRGLRVFRVLSVVKSVKSLRPITRSLLVSLPSCLNVMAVSLLFLFIFAVCAMNLYGLVPHGTTRYGIDENNNFDNFPNALSFLCQMCSGHPYVDVVYELENLGQPFPFMFFSVFTITTQWVLVNLFVVILLDNFMKCFVVSKMAISEDHVIDFKKVWSEAKSDPGGLFGGKPFTTQPECKSIDVRMLEEFVPMLLPPTETLDANWQNTKATASLKLIQAVDVSPLGMIIPHRIKEKDELAMPFRKGQIGHIDGQLVEVIDAKWDSDFAKDEGLPPSVCSVSWLESDEIDAVRVLAEDGTHVPPCERRVGFVDGELVEITWVSNDRLRVRVCMTSKRKKRFATNRMGNDTDQPSWLTQGMAGGASPRADDYYSPKEEKERDEASVKLQASFRGYQVRKEIEQQQQEAASKLKPLSPDRVRKFQSEDGGAGKMGDVETVNASQVHKVTMDGDEYWINRLIVELGISQQEASDGFRYLPPGVKLTDEEGRFLPVVVGLRALASGQFVQDVRVGFHELLLALCIIPMSYGGLNFQEKQEKLEKLRKRGADYAARIFQTCARCKFAKRHLLKGQEPLRKWGKYQKMFGTFESYEDEGCMQRMIFLEAIRDALLDSMRNVFAVKADVTGHTLTG